jgi:hypothetical protein
MWRGIEVCTGRGLAALTCIILYPTAAHVLCTRPLLKSFEGISKGSTEFCREIIGHHFNGVFLDYPRCILLEAEEERIQLESSCTVACVGVVSTTGKFCLCRVLDTAKVEERIVCAP